MQKTLKRDIAVMAALLLALLTLPPLLDSLTSLRAAVVAGICLFFLLLLWFQKPKIPSKIFTFLMSLSLFWGAALVWNADQIKRPRNVWQFMTLADHTPWTGGHLLGAALSVTAIVLLWKSPPNVPDTDREEILSGPRLIPMAEAQEKALLYLKADESTIFWGGLNLPAHCGTEHFAIVGTPGSGKSLSLNLLMKSVLPRFQLESNRRALIYDAKRDTVPLLAGLFKNHPSPPPVRILNPFDVRCSPWRMNRDIKEGATALQIASILIPEGNETQPFFRSAARILLGGVMEAFTYLAPDTWTLRDVILTLKYPHRIATVLASNKETATLVYKYVKGSDTDRSVLATLDTFMAQLKFVAAAWHCCEHEPVSMEHWAVSEEIMVLGSDPKFDAILQPLNRAIFKRAVELTRRQPDVPYGSTKQTWFIVDELRNAGNLEDIDKLLVEGRSKGACVAIGFQDLAGLREVFGEKRADEIVGACANKVFLQNGEGTTIDYATKHFKSQEILETKVSHSYNHSSGSAQDSSGTNTSRQKVMKPVVHEGLLKSLPKPVRGRAGLAGYCDTAVVGTEFPYRMELSPQFLSAELPTTDPDIPGLLERPGVAHTKLPEWTLDDLKRLDLLDRPELLDDDQRPVAPPEIQQPGTEPKPKPTEPPPPPPPKPPKAPKPQKLPKPPKPQPPVPPTEPPESIEPLKPVEPPDSPPPSMPPPKPPDDEPDDGDHDIFGAR